MGYSQLGPMVSSVLNASIHASMRARVAAAGGYSGDRADDAMKRQMALDSKMHTPSGVSSSGTFPNAGPRQILRATS